MTNDFTEEELESLSIMLDVIDYQNNEKCHQLTCGKNSQHMPLLPAFGQNKKVILLCPDCSYVQQLDASLLHIVRVLGKRV